MKILHLFQYYDDEMGYHDVLLPKYQAKLNNDVIVVASNLKHYYPNIADNYKKRKVNKSTYYSDRVKVIRLPIVFELKNRWVIFRNLLNTLIIEKPDIILHHGGWRPSLEICVFYKRKYNMMCKLFVDFHCDFNNTGKNRIYYLFYHKLISRYRFQSIQKYIQMFFYISPTVKTFIRSVYRIPSEKVKDLWLGCDVDKYKKIGKVELDNLRNDLGIKQDDLVLVTSGKLRKEKKIDLIIRAFEKVDSNRVKLVIIGDGDITLVSQLKNMSFNKNIFFVGWVPDSVIPCYFLLASIGIWLTQTVMIQYSFAAGLAVILKYFPGCDYLIQDNGIVVDSLDEVNLANAIQQYVLNPKLLSMHRRKSMELCSNIFSYDKIAANLSFLMSL